MLYVVRYSEIGLKSDRVRRRFEQQLMENIERQTGGKTFKRAARIIVIGGSGNLDKVFGVKSFSPALEVPADIEAIARAALELYRGEKSFAVRAQRVTKDFPLTSVEINREVGARFQAATGAAVDLEHPELTIGVEIIGKKAYVFREKIPGPGGLPVGVSGKVVALVSTGIDSPVAVWMAMKRGLAPILLHFDVGDREAFNRIVEKLNEWYPGSLPVRIVEHVPFLEHIRSLGRLICLACKGRMYLVAERIAKEVGAKALVTGENLGQVASQTLDNLAFLSSLISIPVLRPLIFFDKEEIVEIAKKIGTFELQSKHRCPFVPSHPATHPRQEELEKVRSLLMGLETQE